MKSLDITTRLTATFAFLAALVVAPAAVALYFAVASGYTPDAVEAAKDRAASVADALFGQLTEELLVEFEGSPLNFSALRRSVGDWAIVRAGGRIEHAAGVFARGLDPTAATPRELVPGPDGRRFRIGSVPLIRSSGISLDELPRALRCAAAETCPEAVYLNARSVLDEATGLARAEMHVAASAAIDRLELLGPEKTRILELDCLSEAELGQAEVTLATPGAPLEDGREAYPEGEYLAVGWTSEGELLVHEIEVSHGP